MGQMWKPALLTTRRPRGSLCLAHIQEWSSRLLFRLSETRPQSSRRVVLVCSCSPAVPVQCSLWGQGHVRRHTWLSHPWEESENGQWAFKTGMVSYLVILRVGFNHTCLLGRDSLTIETVSQWWFLFLEYYKSIFLTLMVVIYMIWWWNNCAISLTVRIARRGRKIQHITTLYLAAGCQESSEVLLEWPTPWSLLTPLNSSAFVSGRSHRV